MNFDQINDISGFANGENFKNEEEVRQYFTIYNLDVMFGVGYIESIELTQNDLTDMAETVIDNGWYKSSEE